MESIEKRGANYIELFVVLGITAIISIIIVLIINPDKRFSEIRDRERNSETEGVLDALFQCMYDSGGALPDALALLPEDTFFMIGNGSSCQRTCGMRDIQQNCVNIAGISCRNDFTLIPDYLSSLPVDPDRKKWDTDFTGYYIGKTEAKDIVVGACLGELESIENIRRYQ